MKPIFHAILRTLDVEAAEAFYRDVLGVKPVGVVRLHEQAIARGAQPHWLGLIDVGDVDAASVSFLDRGATRLAPKWINPEGLEAAVMRDPGGAIIALGKPPPVGSSGGPEIVFHTLHTADVARAMALYGALFGWQFDAPSALADQGPFHPFRWDRGTPVVGAFADVEGRPAVHPHWLFHFRVPSLDTAVARVRACGGTALGPFELPSGDPIAVCDDPQGAAFALHESHTK